MLPPALAVWLICLLPAFQGWSMAGWLLSVGLLLAVSAFGLWAFRARWHRRQLAGAVFVLCATGLCAVLSNGMSQAVRQADPVTVAEKTAGVRLAFRVSGPALSSVLRGQDCQYPVQALRARLTGIWLPSGRQLTVFAAGSACSVVESGLYEADGTLEPSTFGQPGTWFTVDPGQAGGQPAVSGGQGSTGPARRGQADSLGPLADRASLSGPGQKRAFQQIQPADPGFQLLQRLRHDFLVVCQRLDEQGRVLVPGVTLGVLGSQSLIGDAVDDQQVGSLIKTDFQRSGIIHLLAVSGGHFVLVADLLRRAAARARLPRSPTAALILLGQGLLALLMYPSDSVLRALVMGVFSTLALARGRPAQPMSALCWTVILCLLTRPALATSYGFALSCAAVLGILLWAGPLNTLLARRLPAWMSLSLSVTLTAQVLTLPVQVLMVPQLPLWSVLANLCVSPIVAASTVCGLASLLVCWAQPSLGLGLAWSASLGTGLMNRCAHFFGNLGGGTLILPLAGLPAAAVVLLLECLVVLLAHCLASGLARRRSRPSQCP